MPMGFSIGVDGEFDDGTVAGRIRVGRFTERFELACGYWTPQDYQLKWREALLRLVEGASYACLMTRMSPPGEEAIRMAWVLCRSKDTVFVQQWVWVPYEHPIRFDDDEQVIELEPRATHSEDGEPISEWRTTVEAVKAFLQLA